MNVIPYTITLRPTMQEFSNFLDYVDKIEKQYGQTYGLVKVIPPAGWSPNKDMNYEVVLSDIIIPGPIEQNAYGKGGIYELSLIQKKALQIREYRRKVDIFEDLTNNKQPEEVEDLFWKNIAFSPPLYGADFQGSFMDKGVIWNLSELKSVLSAGLPKYIPGVSYPYLYVGSWKTMFGWHKEDMDLNSINYNHYGKPKFWYGIAKQDGHKLEYFTQQCFNDFFSICKQHLRHKTVMISPYILKQKSNIIIHKVQQNPGEFVITFAGAYHAGFNWGFNIAEAVNFGTFEWLKEFINATCCRCQQDTVKIDKMEFLAHIKRSIYHNRPEVVEFEKAIKQQEVQEKQKVSSKTKKIKKN